MNYGVGPSSLHQHAQFSLSDEPAYWYFSSSGGEFTHRENCHFTECFRQGEWDVVTLQQCSAESGLPETYGQDLAHLIGLVKQVHPHAKLFWHMTWPYEQGCSVQGFQNYGCDVGKMYEAIAETVKAKILPQRAFDGMLPAGALIHRLSARFGGIFHNSADKLHLNANGEYAVAVLWACLLLHASPEELTEHPAEISDELFAVVKEEVAKLLKDPTNI